MKGAEGTRADWNKVIPTLTEDALLLAELTHRTGNEVAAAIAAMHVAHAAKPGGGTDLLRSAIRRLEGFGEIMHVLNQPTGDLIEVGSAIDRLCGCLSDGRIDADRGRVTRDVAAVWLDGALARRLMMIAVELVSNGIRYALEGRGTTLAVVLRANGNDVRLTVIDDGPGMTMGAPARGTGMGTPIVHELIARGGGTFDCVTGSGGTTVHVTLPIVSTSDVPF